MLDFLLFFLVRLSKVFAKLGTCIPKCVLRLFEVSTFTELPGVLEWLLTCGSVLTIAYFDFAPPPTANWLFICGQPVGDSGKVLFTLGLIMHHQLSRNWKKNKRLNFFFQTGLRPVLPSVITYRGMARLRVCSKKWKFWILLEKLS